ncbi:group I truncated hemoglobin [Phenylobacterium montanum]|uniref:Group 1 truncated hemoglobin n=1 Tax=Phenylobacterium montanum TaxID=2823693 RepID=A0A975G275_9CAUL|nr:group 1 truncated hemoglobin [Caulobacter sp. S6]QUD89198.1 group 1 truncated hemoglobin [Caulobacter sp. S6]
MLKPIALAVGLILAPVAAFAEEQPVDPYVQSNANAGARPFEGEAMLKAFHGREGIGRIVDRMVDLNLADPRISDIFKNQDIERLRRTLKEQFCYILNGGCAYTGRTMKASHKDLGIQRTDFNALVENLQTAMDREGVPFRAQNRLLAKLAPQERDIVER